MSSTIVVGVDGSANSGEALRWAAAEGELRGVPVQAVMSWSYLGDDRGGLKMGTTEADARAVLEEIVTGCLGDDAASIELVLVNDLAVQGLLDASKDAALLVLGHRGHGQGRLKKILMGSVSRTVVERSTVPVVVVPLID